MSHSGSRSHWRGVVGAIAVLALALASCGDDDSGSAGGGPLVVVTTTILGDLVSTLVDDEAEVQVLMPIGVDPHDFEPSAQQAAQLRDADLVVVNGLDLEIGLAGALDSATSDGATVLEVGRLVDTLAVDDHDDRDHDHDHDHGEEDPHVWHDPARMASAVPGLADALIEAVPALDADATGERADALVTTLLDVDAEVEEILAVVAAERRYLVTNHDTFGYFADRYGFEVVGTVIPGGDTLAAPSAGDLAALVAEIDEHDLPAVFADNTVAPGLTRALADEAGRDVEVVTLFTDSLGEPGTDADTYVGMLRTNARLIADALG